jgi:hypothetical protein
MSLGLPPRQSAWTAEALRLIACGDSGLSRREASIRDGLLDDVQVRLGAWLVHQRDSVFAALDFNFLDAGKVTQAQLSPMFTHRSRNAGDLYIDYFLSSRDRRQR